MIKRGQISIFFMLGVILLLAVMLVTNIRDKENDIEDPVLSPSEANSVKLYAEKCIKETIEQGLLDVGSSDLFRLEKYLENNVRVCTNDFSVFRDFQVEEGIISSDIDRTDDELNLLINVDYPLTIKKGDATREVSEFYMTYALSSDVQLSIVGGVTDSVAEVYSRNMLATLTIPSGTDARNIDGTPVNSVSMIIRDNLEYKGDTIGYTIYDLNPDGATFNPPIEMSIKYDETKLSPIVAEESIVISYQDNGVWVAYPSWVDTVNNIVYANVSHFTNTSATTNTSTVNTTVVTTVSSIANKIRVWGYCSGTSSCPAGPTVELICTNQDTCIISGYSSSGYYEYEGEHYVAAISECGVEGATVATPETAFTVNWDDNQGNCENNGGTWLSSATYCGSLGCYGGQCCGDDGNLDDFDSGDPGKCCKNAVVVDDCNECGCPSGYECDSASGSCNYV